MVATWAIRVALFLIVAVVTGCSGSDEPSASDPLSGIDVEVDADVDPGMDEACLRDFAYRASFLETDPATGEEFTQILHEVVDQQIRIEASNGIRILVRSDDAWDYAEGAWAKLPARPVRPLRVPWVNNFITANEIVAQFEHEDVDDYTSGRSVAARIYRPSLDQMVTVFDDRFDDRFYDPATSTFEYWIDACDDVVYADVTLTFAGEDAETAIEVDLPLTLRYTYESYDIGADIAVRQPNTGFASLEPPAG